jgi:rhodanese-related sulfurtransferase
MFKLTKSMTKKFMNFKIKNIRKLGCRDMSYVETNELTRTILASEIKEVIDNYHSDDKIIFLDVREDDECNDGFLPQYNEYGIKLHSVSIPFMDLIEMDHERLNQLEPFKDDHQILIYCRSGNKSVSATRLLNYYGYETINIKGGMKKINKYIPISDNGKFSIIR